MERCKGFKPKQTFYTLLAKLSLRETLRSDSGIRLMPSVCHRIDKNFLSHELAQSGSDCSVYDVIYLDELCQ